MSNINLEEDIKTALKVLGCIVILMFLYPRFAMIGFAGVAVYFFITGITSLISGNIIEINKTQEQNKIALAISAPVTQEPTIASIIETAHKRNGYKCASCGAIANPTNTECPHCGSILADLVDLPRPAIWREMEVGKSIRFIHPKEGEKTETILGRIYYGELFQEKMDRNTPWTLTGRYFAGLFVRNACLLNWQDKFFLLEIRRSLTDKDINRYFAAPARKFGASNQTEEVSFKYNHTNWTITDIGRFRVEFVKGKGTTLQPGVVGRFIHAQHRNQILLIEDFQSGGNGQDGVWLGYLMENKDLEI